MSKKKVFVFDHDNCSGCYNCQIACKDEHCGNEWPPYARPQPMTGMYWLKLNETTHGQVPRVRLECKPVIGAQDESIRGYAPEVLLERDDNLIVIDPEKAKGRKDIADKFEGVYWNEELEIPQGCTGCAHLVDAGAVPHCVEACPFGILKFGDEEEFADIIAAAGSVEDVNGEAVAFGETNFYYLNMPHLFAAGGVYDPVDDEVVIGAKVTLAGGSETKETETDEFGDFWFRHIGPGGYTVTIEAEGFKRIEKNIDLEKSLNLGDFALER